MNNKIILTIVSIFTSLVLILSSFFICAYGIGLEKPMNVTFTEKEETAVDATPSVKEDFTTKGGFRVSADKPLPSASEGVEIISRGGRVVGYRVGESQVGFESFIGAGLTDTVSLNGRTVASAFYERGDMLPDLYLLGKTVVGIGYLEDGRRETVYVNDGYLQAVYDERGRMTESILSGEVEHSFEYLEGELIGETVGGVKYDYTSGVASSPTSDAVELFADRIVYTKGSDSYEYLMEHIYGGKRFVSSIEKNGERIAEYLYLGDRMVSATVDGERVDYLLGADLSHIGMIKDGAVYYFIYDTRGLVYSIVDEDGAPMAFFTNTAIELPTISAGDGLGNSLLDPTRVYHAESGAMFGPSSVTLTGEGGSFGLDDSFTPIRKADLTEGLGFGERCGVSFEVALRAAVLEEAMLKLEGEGYACAANVSLVDSLGERIGTADLYVLSSECADGSIKNALSGDKIYSLVSYTEDRDAKRAALRGYTDEGSGIFVEYFDTYSPKMGDVIFEGQFIYKGYLINYHAEDGLITYRTLENDPASYSGYNDVYDRDRDTYAFISGGEVVTDENYTKLIPGVNREQYDVVEGYIEEAVQICSQTSFDTLGYRDTSYYDSYVNSAMGDTLDLLDGIDPNAMVELTSEGGIKISAIPFFDRSSTRKQLVVAVAGAAVATVVAGIISVVVPGSGAVFIAVLKVAVTQGIIAAGTSIVVSVGIDLAREFILKEELNEAL